MPRPEPKIDRRVLKDSLRVNFTIERPLHRAFKKKVALIERSVSSVLGELIQKYMNE